MIRTLFLLTSAVAVTAAATTQPRRADARQPQRHAVRDTGYVTAMTDSAAGDYLAIVGGCNDCHTPSWETSNGRTPQRERLTGNPVGYRGPWGTSYAANLRIAASRVSEDRWVRILTTADSGEGKPPMPWMNTAQMSQRDLRNLYRYVHALGPAGERMPRGVKPGVEPKTPFILFEPQQPGMRVHKDTP